MHIFDGDFTFEHFFASDEGDVTSAAFIGIFELFSEFVEAAIEFAREAKRTNSIGNFDRWSQRRFVEEAHNDIDASVRIIEHFSFLHDDADAFEAQGDADGGNIFSGEHADEVVVSAAASDARAQAIGLDLEDGACIIIESAGQGRIDLHASSIDAEGFAGFDDRAHFADGLERVVFSGEEGFQGGEGLIVILFWLDDGEEFFGAFGSDFALSEFGGDALTANFIEFIDRGNGGGFEFDGDAGDFDECAEDATIVEVDSEVTEFEFGEDVVNGVQERDLGDGRGCADHVDIALIELAEAAMSRAISAVNGLDLISFKDASDLVLVHGDESGEGHGEVVSEAQVALSGGSFCAAHEDFEEELVAFFAVFTHEGFDIFDGGGFDGFEAMFFVNASDGVHDAHAFAHLLREEIASSFRDTCFNSHDEDSV